MIIDLNKQKNTLILIAFYLLSITFALLTFKDFGVHIEEIFHYTNGHYWLNYISKIFGLTDIQKITEIKIGEISDYTLSSVSEYNKFGVVFDVPAAAIEILFGIKHLKDVYYLKHILSFLIFLFSSFFFFKILNQRYKNFLLSFFGLVLYVTTPRILGDSFLYKDVIFLSFFTITFYFLIKTVDKFNYKNLFFFSIFTALSVNLRFFALLIPILFIFIIIIKNFYLKDYKNILKKIIFYTLCFIVFLYIFWPYLWSDPLNNFLDLFTSLKKDLHYAKIFYNNSYITNEALPETYIINWIIISSPFLQTIFFIFGYLYCFIRFTRRFIKIKEHSIYNDLWRSKKEEIDIIFLLFLTIFYFFFILFNAPLYNGWRLVYFLNIFLIYFAICFLWLIENIWHKKKINRLLIPLVIVSIGYNLYAVAKMHPFQSMYFSSLISDEKKNSYEGDYYGLGSKNFFEKIIKIDKSKIIKIAIASHTPLQRGLVAIPKVYRNKFVIVGQEYSQADYIFKNNISEVDSKFIQKYQIPKNFNKIYELKIDNIIIYEIFKKII